MSVRAFILGQAVCEQNLNQVTTETMWTKQRPQSQFLT